MVANLPHHPWTLTDVEIYAALAPLAAAAAAAEEATDRTVAECEELAARVILHAVGAEGFTNDAPVVEYLAGCIKRERERIAAVMEHQHLDPALIAGILDEDEDPSGVPAVPSDAGGASGCRNVISCGVH